MKRMISALRRDDDGATAIEYAVVAMIISLAIITGATMIGANVASPFVTVAGSLS